MAPAHKLNRGSGAIIKLYEPATGDAVYSDDNTDKADPFYWVIEVEIDILPWPEISSSGAKPGEKSEASMAVGHIHTIIAISFLQSVHVCGGQAGPGIIGGG